MPFLYATGLRICAEYGEIYNRSSVTAQSKNKYFVLTMECNNTSSDTNETLSWNTFWGNPPILLLPQGRLTLTLTLYIHSKVTHGWISNASRRQAQRKQRTTVLHPGSGQWWLWRRTLCSAEFRGLVVRRLYTLYVNGWTKQDHLAWLAPDSLLFHLRCHEAEKSGLMKLTEIVLRWWQM